MCGISGIYSIDNRIKYENLERHIGLMNRLQRHRGPDGQGVWVNQEKTLGLGHNRLSIIDLSGGNQPMNDPAQNYISYNGEIYNYKDLRASLSTNYNFITKSDTEVILASYSKWGVDCVDHLNGMYAFAIWDDKKQRLFCARDPFGIKPFYYTVVNKVLYFASEVKALLPFLAEIAVDLSALQEYLHFQLYLGDKTLFKNIHLLQPGCVLIAENGSINIKNYFQVAYDIDHTLDEKKCTEKLQELLSNSVRSHQVSDVPIGSYVSGGIDSGIITALAAQNTPPKDNLLCFTGKFSQYPGCDESEYARSIAEKYNINIIEQDITPEDFIKNFENIIYYLDYPMAGPGAFPQYMMSDLVAKHRKVVLGGQGGDEVFGGYTRYLIAYLDQYFTSAINGTVNKDFPNIDSNQFIKNISALKNYKMLVKNLWSKNLFSPPDQRYYQLIDRFASSSDQINSNIFIDSTHDVFEEYQQFFNSSNVNDKDFFNKMLNFDFKSLLPALLHIEDRMSMAHGVESRVPFLEKELVSFVAKIPVHIKLNQGDLKSLLKQSCGSLLPNNVLSRKDKMGFPVPFNHWANNEIKEFIADIFSSSKTKQRTLFNCENILESISDNNQNFNRALWGTLSLEIWHRIFLDNSSSLKKLL